VSVFVLILFYARYLATVTDKVKDNEQETKANQDNQEDGKETESRSANGSTPQQ